MFFILFNIPFIFFPERLFDSHSFHFLFMNFFIFALLIILLLQHVQFSSWRLLFLSLRRRLFDSLFIWNCWTSLHLSTRPTPAVVGSEVCNSWYTKLLEHYEGNFHFKTLNKSNISYWNVKLNMKHIYTRLIDKDWFIVCDFLSKFITFKTERQTDLSNRKTD